MVEKSVKWNAYLQQLEAGGGASANATLIGEALKESFMAIDIMIRDEQDAERAKAAVQGGQRGVQPGYGDGGLDTSGCTAVVCIVNEKVWSWFRGAARRARAFTPLASLRPPRSFTHSHELLPIISPSSSHMPKFIVCSNAGDSRCVMGTNNSTKPLSDDHKPMNQLERARIEAAGGYVSANRVEGNLAVSR